MQDLIGDLQTRGFATRKWRLPNALAKAKVANRVFEPNDTEHCLFLRALI